MKVITINNLNDGIDVKNDPSVVAEGGVVDCVGFDLTHEGVLRTAKGLAINDISAQLPVGLVQWFQKVYLGTTLYVLATTADGLYANGALIDATLTGRFKAIGFIRNIFITNGVVSRRFDGTTCYQWGITAPTTMPTIAAGTQLYKTLEDFENIAATWTANVNSCTCVAEAGAALVKAGTKSAKFTVAAGVRGYSYRAFGTDINGKIFSTGEVSTDKDYVRFWLYCDTLPNLQEVVLFIDVGDGTFKTDFYSYTITPTAVDTNSSVHTVNYGGTGSPIYEETTTTTETEPSYIEPPPYSTGYGSDERWFRSDPVLQPSTKTITITRTQVPNTSSQSVEPVVSDQSIVVHTLGRLITLKSATWTEFKIPKSMFISMGDGSKSWDTIAAIKIEVAAKATGGVNVYIDDLKIVGGSDLVGDYWFMYNWGRMDSSGNVIHESAPSRAAKQVNIAGPIRFDREPLSYSARPLSGDPQVNCGIFYAIGGGLTSFWNVLEVADNTTTSGTPYGVGEGSAKRMLTSKGNEPAPAGTDMVLLYNKIWMVGDSNYPHVLRSSDILSDGTLAPEGWPTRNGYEFTDNHGELTNIKVLNKQLTVKGRHGEWVVRINDATDYLQVIADKVSDKGLLSRDGVVVLPGSHIYPSNRGFVESNGAQANFILPEIEPLIDDNISNAIGVSSGLINYFTYNNGTYGTRTAKVDTFRGKPRFTNLNNILLECIEHDPVADKTYCVQNGNVYILDEGYTNEADLSRELFAFIKSRVYRPGARVAWHRVEFTHNTGGSWYRLEVYVDGVLMNSFPFMSTTRTLGNFRFGPFAGNDFQFVITGNYISMGEVNFPMRIHHSGN